MDYTSKVDYVIKQLEECDRNGDYYFLVTYNPRKFTWVGTSGFPGGSKYLSWVKNTVIDLVNLWYQKASKLSDEEIEREFESAWAKRKSS